MERQATQLHEIMGWHGEKQMRGGGDSPMDEVTVYTNVEAPGDQLYEERYDGSNAKYMANTDARPTQMSDGVRSYSDGVLTLENSEPFTKKQVALFDADSFPSEAMATPTTYGNSIG